MLFIFNKRDETFYITDDHSKYLRPPGKPGYHTDRKCICNDMDPVIFAVETILQRKLYIIKEHSHRYRTVLTDNPAYHRDVARLTVTEWM